MFVSVIHAILIAGLVVLIAAAVAFEVFCLYALAKTMVGKTAS